MTYYTYNALTRVLTAKPRYIVTAEGIRAVWETGKAGGGAGQRLD